MLTTKRINLGILMLSRLLRLFMIFYSASILANCIWWVLSPANTNIFIQWADLDIHDKATSYINNRNPFGIIVVTKAKEKEKPRVVDQLKLTGVYLNTNKDSFAFLEYQGKPTVVKIGGTIADSGAVVKDIGIDDVVVMADGQEATIQVTRGTASATNPPLGNVRNAPETMFGNRQMNNNAVNPNQAAEDFRQQRQRVMEEFNARNNTGRTKESSSDDDE